MGSSQKILDVIYDTGSDWLMVESYECWNCEGRGNSTGEVYNTTKGIMNSADTNKLEQRLYGEVFLEGSLLRMVKHTVSVAWGS